jgi:hypothetical protein
MKSIERIPKDYDGLDPTGRSIETLLPQVLKTISKNQQQSILTIELAWKEIVGAKISEFTKVYDYQKGVLFIKVKNATLLSILSSQEKPRLMQNLKEKLPNIHFAKLVFQFG